MNYYPSGGGGGGGGGGGTAGPINLASLGLALLSDPAPTLTGPPTIGADSIQAEVAAGGPQDPSDGAILLFDLVRDSLGQSWPSPLVTQRVYSLASRIQPGSGTDLSAVVGPGLGVAIGLTSAPAAPPTTIDGLAYRAIAFLRTVNRAGSLRAPNFVSQSGSIASGPFSEVAGSYTMVPRGTTPNACYNHIAALLDAAGDEVRNANTSGNTDFDVYMRPCIILWRVDATVAPQPVDIRPIFDIALQDVL